MQKLSSKEQFDACMKLADFAAGRWDARRQYDWKFALGLWGLLAAAAGFAKADAFPIWIGLLIIVLHVVWIRSVWLRSRQDSSIVWRSIEAANQILEEHGLNVVPDKNPVLRTKIKNKTYQRHFGFLGEYASGIQICTTVALVILFYMTKITTITWLTLSGVVIRN